MILMSFMFRMMSSSVVMTLYWRWHENGVCLGHIGWMTRKTLAVTDSNSNICKMTSSCELVRGRASGRIESY